ncbi:hypothetical protein GCK72_019576 [Caenorhabditis remanei]|uniref:Receptor L-domain domain-containing protein n=1 Tax=Caenorhabditis remanei TaxID=31234 RepID=A0A6A5GD81_CAERE|nr:hypothetical protein GCK72_019576 [Caenorhabditis remanei]KAF1753020.1 hypothetical protein GCK72_019576 [Caenorhabditis remanei]
MNAYGNLKDCECFNVRITPESLPFYQNCSYIHGGEKGVLKITKVTEYTDLSPLSFLKKVNGNIEIFDTELTNLSFLSNLETIIGERFQAFNITQISNNPKLKRLGWDSLKVKDSITSKLNNLFSFQKIYPDQNGFSLSITNNHPEFCFSTNELQTFAEGTAAFYDYGEISLCPETARKDGQKVCNFDDLNTMESDCVHVIGDVVINAENESNAWKLQNTTHIYGSLMVEETKELTNLSFLSNFRVVATLKVGSPSLIQFLDNKKLQNVSLPQMKTPPFPITEDSTLRIDDGFVIANNPDLSDIKHLDYWYTESECVWHIINNTKADLSKFCDYEDSNIFNSNLDAYGNLNGCACKNARISPESLPYYKNCTSITGGRNGGLKITKVTDHMDLSPLLFLKKVNGNVEIFDTELTNLSFLGNLETMIGESIQIYNITNIHDNPNLKRLGWDSLKNIYPKEAEYTFNLERNHQEFCLTTYELQAFASSTVHFYNLNAKICPELERKDGQKVCIFELLSNLDPTCQHVIGDVLVNSENENEVWRLKNMTNTYGSITVENTIELTDLDFLSNFQQVATLNLGGPAMIRILFNKNLRNISLPKMTTPPFPDTESHFEINGNSLDIFKNQKECRLFQKHTQSYLKYNGKSCAKLEAADPEENEVGGSKSETLSSVQWFLVLTIFTIY